MPKRKKLSPEFKRKAGAMTGMPGATVRQVASDPDIGEGMLGHGALQGSKWLPEAQIDSAVPGFTHGIIEPRDHLLLRLQHIDQAGACGRVPILTFTAVAYRVEKAGDSAEAGKSPAVA